MKKLLTLLTLALIPFYFGACTIIGGIFKTGMGVGMFIIIALLLLVGVFIAKGRKK